MDENYTFSADTKINMDEPGIKTSCKIYLFPLNFKPESNIGMVEWNGHIPF